MTMNEEAYQREMDDQAQFEAEQQALKDDVYDKDKLANCYAIVREMITNELTSDVSPTNWSKIECIAIAMQDLAHYLSTDDWENALNEIRNYV